MGSSSHSSKRKKKRSQKRSKKRIKSSGEKSKKRKRRHDSDSFSDEDSADVLSVSCSSSDDEYASRSRRGRLRDRKDKKRRDRKKKVKKSRLVSESSGDEEDYVKKRERSRKSKGSESKKKWSGKKRLRDRSVSSGGWSRSCSPCDRSDGSEMKFKIEKGKERKGVGKRNGRSGSEESRHRSRSCSPCSVRSEGCILPSEERVTEENKSVRLKSVIVAADEREEAEVRELYMDRNEDEFVYEHDDYPSKSNDSNDGFTKREALSFSLDASSGKPITLDDPMGGAVSVNARDSEFSASRNLVVETSGKGSMDEAHNANGGSRHSDLETILRQKALENLLKRQGKACIKTPLVRNGDSESEKSSTLKSDAVQHMPDDQVTKPVQKVAKVDSTTFVSSALKGTVARVSTGDCAEVGPNAGLSMPRKEFIGRRNTWRRQVSSQEAPQSRPSLSKESIDGNSKPQLISRDSSHPNLLTPKEAVDTDSTRRSISVSHENKESTDKIYNVAASEPSATLGQSSMEKTDDPVDGSGFQQKTMSVMRGGELVEVSYKVYIPKKAPALARRRLNR